MARELHRSSPRRAGRAAIASLGLAVLLAGCAVKEAPAATQDPAAQPAASPTSPGAGGADGGESAAGCGAASAAIARIEPAIERAAAQLDADPAGAQQELGVLADELGSAAATAEDPSVAAMLEDAAGKAFGLAEIAANPALPDRLGTFGAIADELGERGEAIAELCGR